MTNRIPTLRVLTLHTLFRQNANLNLLNVNRDCLNQYIVFCLIYSNNYLFKHKHKVPKRPNIFVYMNHWYRNMYITSRIPKYQLDQMFDLIEYNPYRNSQLEVPVPVRNHKKIWTRVQVSRPRKLRFRLDFDPVLSIKTFRDILESKSGRDIAYSKYKYDCIAYNLLMENTDKVLDIIDHLSIEQINKYTIGMYIRKQFNICDFPDNGTHGVPMYLRFRIYLNKRFGIDDFTIEQVRVINNGYTFQKKYDRALIEKLPTLESSLSFHFCQFSL